MRNQEIRLEQLTRRECREAIAAGHFKAAIIPTGSTEQHLEHLALSQDIAGSTYIAERVAENLYPNVVVAVPMSIGISEHHMHFAATLSAKPGSWLAVMFDAVESLMRHGIKKVLLLNGHGGNVAPVKNIIEQWQLFLAQTQGSPLSTDAASQITNHQQYKEALLEMDNPGMDLRFHSYWDLVSKGYAEEVLETGRYPGHAQEFETSFALYAFPENVRLEAIPYNEDQAAAKATAEKGRMLTDKAIEEVSKVVEEMLAK